MENSNFWIAEGAQQHISPGDCPNPVLIDCSTHRRFRARQARLTEGRRKCIAEGCHALRC